MEKTLLAAIDAVSGNSSATDATRCYFFRTFSLLFAIKNEGKKAREVPRAVRFGSRIL